MQFRWVVKEECLRKEGWRVRVRIWKNDRKIYDVPLEPECAEAIENLIRKARLAAEQKRQGDEPKPSEQADIGQGACQLCGQTKPLMALQPICRDCY